MKHTVLIAASVAALALAGCKKEAPPAGDGAGGVTSDEMAVATPSISPSHLFANTAASSDVFEIESSRLAETRAMSSKVKTFARQMIEAHTASTAKLKAVAAMAPVPELSPMQQQALADLGAKSGAAFDTAYAKVQVDAHQTALDGLKAYAATGDDPALKRFATEIIPTVTGHLNMAKGL